MTDRMRFGWAPACCRCPTTTRCGWPTASSCSTTSPRAASCSASRERDRHEPDDVAAALRKRWDGLADRLTVHCAADPGAEVWPAIAARMGDRVWLRDVEGNDLLSGTATVEVPDGLR